MRLDILKSYVAGNVFAVEVNYLDSLLNILNNGIDRASLEKEEINTIAPGHYIQKTGNVAVIKVDGTTVKKNDWFNAYCGGFIGYNTIAEYIDNAVSDDNIDTIFFRIDTRGGEVAGVDELFHKIRAVGKKTVTLYENIGASAGIWWGCASDNIYATQTTILGSIGVYSTYKETKETNDIVKVFSKNAENKDCSLKGDCKNILSARVDKYEELFISRVSEATGLEKDKIINGFDKGGTIFAQEAKKLGFVKDIITFDKLLEQEITATMPPAGKNSDNNTGDNMDTEITNTAEITNSERVPAGVPTGVPTEANTAGVPTEASTAGIPAEIAMAVITVGAELVASKDTMLKALKQKDVASAKNVLYEDNLQNRSTGAFSTPSEVHIKEQGKNDKFALTDI